MRNYRLTRWQSPVFYLAAGLVAAVAVYLCPRTVTGIFSSTYLPHGFCYFWNPRLLALHIVTDGTIALSYLSISITLGYLVYRCRHDIPYKSVFTAFGIFIVACGMTHAMEILVLWHPLYWLAGDVKLVTAIASLATAIMLPYYLPRITRLLGDAQVSRQNERWFLAATESSLDSFYILEAVRDEAREIVDFSFVFVNSNGARLINREPQNMLGKNLCDLLPMNRTEGFFDQYKRVFETGEPIIQEFPILDKSINASWLKHQVVKLGDGIAITVSNTSDHKNAEIALERASLAQSIIESSPLAIVVTEMDGTILGFNRAAEKLLWYTKAELIGKRTPLLFHDPVELKERARDLSSELGYRIAPDWAIFQANLDNGRSQTGEWSYVRKGGSRVQVEISIDPLKNAEGIVTGHISTAHDITERKRREEYVTHIAQHDALTGLPTRQLLIDRLQMSINRAERYRTQCAVLMIDLNKFKSVNDSFGHQAGDILLIQVAERFCSVVRTTDTVARMGGDEFIVLVTDLDDASGAEVVAAKLVAALNPPFLLSESLSVAISASIGICVFPEGGKEIATLLRNADLAMYHAKSKPRQNVQTFSTKLAEMSLKRHDLEVALHDALRNDELELYYQPRISLDDGNLVGVEALLRWNSRKLGLVMPNDFIPIAEETGLILPIGEWVLHTACRQSRLLSQQYGRPLLVAVNLSPQQLEQENLLAVIEQALTENELPPEALEIEITETMLVSDSPVTVGVLHGIRALGVRIAIDDFGTGFSSMAYLLRFAIDRLKIDRSFIQNCSTESNSSAVTSAIIALAHQLKLTVVAEGVETRDQVAFLRGEGCDEVQGYYFSRPLALDAILNTISSLDFAASSNWRS